ncbi:hypothetical protein ACW9HQ_40060 [Nocardia gipuzkoensis]
MTDPFVNAPNNFEAAAETEPGVEFVQSNVSEAVITLKGDGQAPWTVIHTPDIQAARAQFEGKNSDDLRATLKYSVAMTAEYAEMYRASTTGAQSAGVPQSTAPAKPAYQQAPGGETRTCKHGQMIFKSGVTASGPRAGQAWSAWMCPAPQGTPDQCKKQWLH